MDFTEKTTEELIERRTAINAECENADADLDALMAEAKAINEELETRKANEAKRNDIRKAVADGAGAVIDEHKTEMEERHIMTNEEIRNSKEYVEAYANYIKTEDDKECRSLLTENASGVLPVPAIVDEIVRTAWERDEIMNLVKKTYIRGNLKVSFERSATEAVVHTEGTSAPSEETLTLGIVTMIPKNIKKWIDREAA